MVERQILQELLDLLQHKGLKINEITDPKERDRTLENYNFEVRRAAGRVLKALLCGDKNIKSGREEILEEFNKKSP